MYTAAMSSAHSGRGSANETSPCMSTISRSSENRVARCRTEPSGAITIDPPSNTSSSWPPTALTYTIVAPVCRARSRRIDSRSPALPWW